VTEANEWFVQAGSEGQWVTVTRKHPDRDEAIEHLEWYRLTAHSTLYRLVRETTVVTITVEDI
jgi:hypothetical protein